jgi:hypothetical protein
VLHEVGRPWKDGRLISKAFQNNYACGQGRNIVEII